MQLDNWNRQRQFMNWTEIQHHLQYCTVLCPYPKLHAIVLYGVSWKLGITFRARATPLLLVKLGTLRFSICNFEEPSISLSFTLVHQIWPRNSQVMDYMFIMQVEQRIQQLILEWTMISKVINSLTREDWMSRILWGTVGNTFQSTCEKKNLVKNCY